MTAEKSQGRFSKTKWKDTLKFMKLKIQRWPTKVKLDYMKRLD